MNARYIKKIDIFFVFVLALGLGPSVYAASFDCSKAVGKIEKIICSDTTLSQLDTNLGAAFNSIKTTNPKIVNEQKKWLHEQRNVCQEVQCLVSAYNDRINELKKIGDCPIDENLLIGSWARVKNGFFEEMNFSVNSATKVFVSWIHHRPEMTGTWDYSECMIHIKHSNDEKLQFDFKVQKIDREKLYVFDSDTNLNAIYKKIQAAH